MCVWGGEARNTPPRTSSQASNVEMRRRVQRLLTIFFLSVVSFPLVVVCVIPLFRSVAAAAAATRGAKTRAPTRGRARKTLRTREQIREAYAHRLDAPHVFALRPSGPQTRAARDDFTGKDTAG